MCEEIWESASQAIINAANSLEAGDRADVVDIINDPAWVVSFRLACEAWWARNIAQEWGTAFQNPDATPPQAAVPDGFLLGRITNMVRAATLLATNSPPATSPLHAGTDPTPRAFDVRDLVEVGQRAAENAARNLLRRRR